MRRYTFPAVALALLMVILSFNAVFAREGDTLEPIQIDAPTLQTWPETLLNDDDARLIEQRVNEARNAGVPLAVRIVDMSLPNQELPFHLRQYAREDIGQPISLERQQAMAEAWANAESIETSDGANDGFLLLVLVPEDRTQTQAIWWIGPNALPINGLTQANILATHAVMNTQFVEGNMPNGVFLGLSEFSHNIQFGVPERLTRSDLQNALHWATIPMAVATVLASVSIPIVIVRLSGRNRDLARQEDSPTPWEAAALHQGRARQNIPTAMLLDSFHKKELSVNPNGGLSIQPGASNPAIDALRPFADEDGVVNAAAIYEIEAIMVPVRDGIEGSLAAVGAMTPNIQTDRARMLLAMGLTAFLAALTVVPSVVSMSAIGIYAIALGMVGIAIGWWWLAYRSYTSPAGKEMLDMWLESASGEERAAFDLAVYQDLLTDQSGGPEVAHQTKFVRQLRGLGAN